jgi:hypothetical protein
MDIYLPSSVLRLDSKTEMDMDMDFEEINGPGKSQQPLVVGGDERRNNPGGDDSRPPGDHYRDYDERRGRRPRRRGSNVEDEEEEVTEDDGTYEVNGFKFKHSEKALLIVNLYGGERNGYTFSAYLPETELEEAKTFVESHLIPYNETYLLDCVNTETVPIRLIAKLEKMNGIDLMRYRNCVICELRDFRRFPNAPSPQTNEPVCRQIILRPNNQTLLSDLDRLIEKGYEDRKMYKNMRAASNQASLEPPEVSALKRRRLNPDFPFDRDRVGNENEVIVLGDPNDDLSLDQRLELEKRLVKETAGGLCLDPSKQVGLIANRAQYEKYKWNAPELRKTANRWARKKRKLEAERKYDLFQDFMPGEAVPPPNTTYDFYDRELIENTCKTRRDFVPFLKFVTKAVKSHKLKRETPEEAVKLPPMVSIFKKIRFRNACEM